MASAYLNARARALIGQILPTETLLRLADLPTVENITRQLESQGYFRYRNGAEEALSPVQRLWLELDQDYRAAITVVSGPGRAVLRAMYGQRYPRLAAAIVLAGFVAILVTLTWVNVARLFAGLHSYA